MGLTKAQALLLISGDGLPSLPSGDVFITEQSDGLTYYLVDADGAFLVEPE